MHPQHHPELHTPLCAVKPQSTDEVRRIVQFANAEKIALVPFGGGSGLMGGALVDPAEPGHRSARHESNCRDRYGRTFRARPSRRRAGSAGRKTKRSWVSFSATIHGRFPLPPSAARSRPTASAIAPVFTVRWASRCWAWKRCLPNGETSAHATGVETFGGHCSLNALLIGGEGCFGMITEATIRIFPKPEARIFCGLSLFFFRAGIRGDPGRCFMSDCGPALLDFGDDEEKHDPGALLYLVFEGNARNSHGRRESSGGDLRRQRRQAAAAGRSRSSSGTSVMKSRAASCEPTPAPRARSRRHLSRLDSCRFAGIKGSGISQRAAQELIQRRGVRLQESGLWVQPELFSMRLGADEDTTPNAQLVLEETVEELLRLVQQMGGSMEYTHGVGVKLAPLMAEEHGYGLEVMRQIKKTLDPNNIMNPGKLGL